MFVFRSIVLRVACFVLIRAMICNREQLQGADVLHNEITHILFLVCVCARDKFLETQSIHERARERVANLSRTRCDEFVLLDGKFALYGLPTPLENCLILCHQIVVCSADETTLRADLCFCIARLLIFTGTNFYGVFLHTQVMVFL